MTPAPEMSKEGVERLMFELFKAKKRTRRLRRLTSRLYNASDHVKQPADWLGDRVEDLCRWDLNRQYERSAK